MGGRKTYVMPQSTKDKISKAHSRKIKFNCDNCGNESEDKPSHYARKKKHFCSMACYAIYRKEKFTMEEHNSYRGVRKPGESKQVYHRNYVRKNPENIARLKAKRYELEKNAEGGHTDEEWENLKREYNFRCAHCNKRKKLCRDHIIPLCKGGSSYISNIQPLCANCNSKKWIN